MGTLRHASRRDLRSACGEGVSTYDKSVYERSTYESVVTSPTAGRSMRASRPNRFKAPALSPRKGQDRQRTPSPITRMPGENSGAGNVVGGHG